MLAWSHPAPWSRGAALLLLGRAVSRTGYQWWLSFEVILVMHFRHCYCSSPTHESVLLPTPFILSTATWEHTYMHAHCDEGRTCGGPVELVVHARGPPLSGTLVRSSQPCLDVMSGLAGHTWRWSRWTCNYAEGFVMNGKNQPRVDANRGLPGPGTSYNSSILRPSAVLPAASRQWRASAAADDVKGGEM